MGEKVIPDDNRRMVVESLISAPKRILRPIVKAESLQYFLPEILFLHCRSSIRHFK